MRGEAVSMGLEDTVTSSQEDLVTFLVKEMLSRVCSRGQGARCAVEEMRGPCT